MTLMNARRVFLGLTGLLMLAPSVVPDDALAQDRKRRRAPRGQLLHPNPIATPMLAVVGLREQRITIYDSTGAQMYVSPVSSGTTGYETPPGVFSVVQKEIDHASNLYDDASMPFMQRLTWTGIALHAGVLPGYAASHGCVRMPYDFAQRLFDQTNIGMRVVVAREGIAPVTIATPSLFRRNTTAMQAGSGAAFPLRPVGAKPDADTSGHDTSLMALRARSIALSRDADVAEYRARDLAREAARAKAAARPAERAVTNAQTAIDRIEVQMKAAEATIERGGPPKRLASAQEVKAAAPARIEAARAKLAKVQAETNTKRLAASDAAEQAAAATLAHANAVEASQRAKQDLAPISVFVSRKTQRIYVRKAFHPLWEGPVFIRDPDSPIGTFVFTALDTPEGSTQSRWSVVSLYTNPTAIEPPMPRTKSGKHAPSAVRPVTDVKAVEAALARLDVPSDMADRISDVILPGSSLVISDEAPHLETGKDTDFVVIMSGEPQGGITIRQKPERSYARDNDDEYDHRARSRRSRGGNGGFSFWFD